MLWDDLYLYLAFSYSQKICFPHIQSTVEICKGVTPSSGEVYTGFWWGNLRERDHLKDPGVEGDNIKMDLQELGCGGMDWIDLAQDRDKWWARVKAVMKLRGVP